MAGLGLRGRGPVVRRPVRPARGHLHRPQRRGDAQARRQDRLEADRRGGGRARGSVEPGRRRDPRGRAGGCRGHRLPADAQGDRRRRRPRDPDGGVRRRPRGRLPAHQRRGTARLRQRHGLPRAPGDRRPARRGAADRRQPRHRLGDRRPRLLDPAPQPEGDRGVVVAAASTRADRRAQGRGRASGARRRVRRSGHGRVPLPPRARRASRSSRSTPGCRSSTRSPRSPPTSTSSRRRSTSPAAAGSRASGRPRRGMPSRRA